MEPASIIESIGHNPSAPTGILLRILNHSPAAISDRISYQALADDLVDAVVAHDVPRVRGWLAENLNATPEQRARLVDDPSPMVRMVCAIGPTWFRKRADPLPESAQRRLLNDPVPEVRREAALGLRSPALAAELHDDPDPLRRCIACRGWDLLDENARRRLLADEDPSVRATAARQISDTDPDATDIYLAAVEHDTFWDRSVLDTAALHPSTAERLVRTGTSTQRAAMALNPHVRKDLAMELAADCEHHVRMMLASRPDLTEGERAAIDYLIDERDRLDPLHWVYGVTDAGRLRELAGSGNILIRRSLAYNRHLPQDVVDLLSADDDFAVRILLCENQPTVSPDVLWDTYERSYSVVASSMIQLNPNFPRERIGRPAPPPPLPIEHLASLVDDPDDQVAGRAMVNPGLPVEIMHALLDRAGVPRLPAS